VRILNISISWNDEENSIILPVNPESFEISGAQNNTSLYIHNLGEINLKGKRGLYEIAMESFFPAQKYAYHHGKHHDPYDYYCKKLTNLYEKNETVHLVITETDINMYCTIESFAHGEAERNGDVKYKISFKEYRESASAKRVSTKKKETSYTWKSGDTWSKVVKKKLGSSKTWKTVRKNNSDVIKKAKKKHPKKKEKDALAGYKVVIK
jgi:hypothetical protein